MKWKNVTLWKFQQIDLKNSQQIEEIDKTLFAVCYLFGYTESQLDVMPLKKVQGLCIKVKKLFESELKVSVKKRIGRYVMQLNPEQLTFGQYVELSYFFTMPPVQAAHYILASISRAMFCKHTSNGHKERADYFQTKSVTDVLGTVKHFAELFADFNKKFPGLFEVGAGEGETESKTDPFNRRYGWTFCVSSVAEYERISLDEAYNLPIMQALNDLVYLKEKQSYEEKILAHARKSNSGLSSS